MVRDVMTRGVETATPDATIAEVARRMRDLDVGSLPVTEGSKLLVSSPIATSAYVPRPRPRPERNQGSRVMSPELAWIFRR